jgi:hypothetical protein
VVAAEVDIPERVLVETVGVPNEWKHEIKQDGNGRIVRIVWTMNIPAGEFAASRAIHGTRPQIAC